MSSAAAARNPAAAPTLADCPRLFHAADGFIRGNTNFESSIAINMVVDEAATCTGYSDSVCSAVPEPIDRPPTTKRSIPRASARPSWSAASPG